MPDHQPKPDEPDYRCGDAIADAERIDRAAADIRAIAERRALDEYRPIADQLAIVRARAEQRAIVVQLSDGIRYYAGGPVPDAAVVHLYDKPLGYPDTLGYDQPRADDPADFTGPDADVPALIAAHHRGTGSDHHAISDAQHATRYLDDDERGRFYD